jgi:hypothetical protein
MKALEPVVEEFKPAKEEKKSHGKRHSKKEAVESLNLMNPKSPK